jgi:hypothetical protein
MAAATALVVSACGGQLVIPTANVGDCVQSSDLDSEATQFTVVACDESHDAEVFALVELTYGGEYDEDAIIEESNDACLERFEGYVGADYNDSVLVIRPVHPTEVTWNAGDTQTVCVATSPEMVTESFAGSGI